MHMRLPTLPNSRTRRSRRAQTGRALLRVPALAFVRNLKPQAFALAGPARVPPSPGHVIEEHRPVPLSPRIVIEGHCRVPLSPGHVIEAHCYVPLSPVDVIEEHCHVPSSPGPVIEERRHVPLSPGHVPACRAHVMAARAQVLPLHAHGVETPRQATRLSHIFERRVECLSTLMPPQDRIRRSGRKVLLRRERGTRAALTGRPTLPRGPGNEELRGSIQIQPKGGEQPWRRTRPSAGDPHRCARTPRPISA